MVLAVITGAGVFCVVTAPAPDLAWMVAGGWGLAAIGAISGYVIGRMSEEADSAHLCVGHWMAWPVDDDGTPSAPPFTGHLIRDERPVIGRR